MVVVKFLVSVSEVELQYFQKFSPGLLGGQKDTFAPPTQLLGGACPGCPPKSTPMVGITAEQARLSMKVVRANETGTESNPSLSAERRGQLHRVPDTGRQRSFRQVRARLKVTKRMQHDHWRRLIKSI